MAGPRHPGRCSSMVEQLICNQQVGGSSPFAGFLDPMRVYAEKPCKPHGFGSLGSLSGTLRCY